MGVIERKYPSGRRSYGIQWFDEHGDRQREFNRAWTTKAQAKAAYDVIIDRQRAGVAARPEWTVAQLFEEWRENHVKVNCSPAYYRDVEVHYRLRIEPMIGHRRIDTVDRQVVRKMMAQMKQVMREKFPDNEYGGHRAINKTLTVLKGMLSYAVQCDMLTHNPAHGVKELSEEPQRMVSAWPMPAIEAVAREALVRPERLPEFQRSQQAPWQGQRDYTIVMLAALTGLRQSELLGLTWECVDGEWLHVTHKLDRVTQTLRETKSRRGRRSVPLLAAARQVLDEWRAVGAHDEILFPAAAGGYLHAVHFDNRVWRRARKLAGVVTVNGREHDCNKMTFHQLRHTFASMCLAAGRDVWEVAHWIGDDPELVKRVYGHYIPDTLGDTSRLDAMLTISQPVPKTG
ncbi:MAG: site-specific integrase [Thermoleophilia bacterium]|nr:site-specific integrase [Thermoleophilia bacterium]